MSAFQLKRGSRSELPSSLPEGDHFIVISDSGNPVSPPELYVGPDGGGTPVRMGSWRSGTSVPSSLDQGQAFLKIDTDPPTLYVGPQGGGSPVRTGTDDFATVQLNIKQNNGQVGRTDAVIKFLNGWKKGDIERVPYDGSTGIWKDTSATWVTKAIENDTNDHVMTLPLAHRGQSPTASPLVFGNNGNIYTGQIRLVNGSDTVEVRCFDDTGSLVNPSSGNEYLGTAIMEIAP